jgi:N-acetylneuraminate synthase/N,N'-diacetyllegionaminate synthase
MVSDERNMRIGRSRIGPDAPPYFVAEAGVNHDGDVDVAERLIDAAAEAGADAVKFQTFDADRLVTSDAATADYQAEATGETSQRELLRRCELDRAAHGRLLDRCRERGIAFLSTPFGTDSADLLADLGVPAIKLGSGDLDNHPLLEHVAEFGIPMIVSTGMGTMAEVRAAREAIGSVAPDRDLCLLHCTSAYPCDPDEVNLRAMEAMAAEFSVPVGYSDHTTFVETPALAIAAGAAVVEKHFTLDSTRAGPDHEASLEPDELASAVDLAETAGRMRGDPEKRPTATERRNRSVTRKSLRAAHDLPAGTEVTPEDVRIARPADGLAPRHLDRLLGTTLAGTVRVEEPFTRANTGLDPD